MLDHNLLRKAGSKAFFELKKYPFYDVKTNSGVTTVSLFGDAYQFFIDSNRKIVYMDSKYHYKKTNVFKLGTRHKDWEGIFSFPRFTAHQVITKSLYDEGCEAKGAEEAKTVGLNAKIVANQAYKANKQKLSGIFGGILWKQYDPEMASLAVKIHGLTANSLDYTIIWNNKEEILDTINKAPGILPIWRHLISIEMVKKRKVISKPVKKSVDDSFLESWSDSKTNKDLNESSPSLILGELKYSEEVNNFVFPNIIEKTKKYLEKRGITPAGWRFLTKLPPRFTHVIVNRMPFTQIVPWINWFAAIGVVPRFSLLKHLIGITVLKTDSFTVLMRAALTHASKMRRGVRSFYQDEIQLVIDWFRNNGQLHAVAVTDDFVIDDLDGSGTNRQVELDSNQRRAKWSWFMRQQEEWHQRINAENAARDRDTKKVTVNESWTSVIDEFEYKGHIIVPLVNTHSLIDEGKEMRHCVGSYTEQCLSQISMIFSILKDDKRIATLELEKYGDRWVIHQCRGRSNSDVSSTTKKIAEEVCKRYNKVYRQQWERQLEAV